MITSEKKVYRGIIPFGNGDTYSTDRYYVVIKSDDDYYYLLNCSSIRKKRRKLMFASNTELEDCIPPLKEPTFVKMDEIYRIPVKAMGYLIPNGDVKEHTYTKLKSDFANYRTMNYVKDPTIYTYTVDEIQQCN